MLSEVALLSGSWDVYYLSKMSLLTLWLIQLPMVLSHKGRIRLPPLSTVAYHWCYCQQTTNDASLGVTPCSPNSKLYCCRSCSNDLKSLLQPLFGTFGSSSPMVFNKIHTSIIQANRKFCQCAATYLILRYLINSEITGSSLYTVRQFKSLSECSRMWLKLLSLTWW